MTGCSAPSGAGSAGTQSKRIVGFLPSSSYAYLVDYVNAAKAEAKARGYELTVYENNFDQSVEDQQVQQVVASGDRPAGFLFWPSNPQAAVNSTRQLSRIAPVVQLNAQVLPEAKNYVKAFAGPDDVTVGRIAGEMAIRARTEAVAGGRLAKGAPGNLIELAFPEVYTPGAARTQGFADATKDAPFTVLRKEFVGTDANSGFAAANTLIPQYRARGLDFIYVHNAELAVGVVRALRQNGLVPGKDVTVIVGDGNGGKALLANGEVYSAVVQSANIDGTLAVRSMVQYLETAKVQPGRSDAVAQETMPAYTSTPPYEATFLPLVGVTAKDASSLKLWGFDFEHLLS
ncbi:sugar ABC transporter substrate-binding protein [Saccharopolyspora spinosa]|uniref:sugar ABC transporter substrate-binding protein n=1 Tax=Saccharopolyspora spinosa TaxID=60894 RepID=UPI000237AE6E